MFLKNEIWKAILFENNLKYWPSIEVIQKWCKQSKVLFLIKIRFLIKFFKLN